MFVQGHSYAPRPTSSSAVSLCPSLQLLALELHHADMALAHHAASVAELLAALFGAPEASDPGGGWDSWGWLLCWNLKPLDELL